ncbi:helix-turn-helix domain-containing protein [Nocardiopsis metallicus]|uniref:Transcriptional regulator with XRE-family HTH domain n=1 Tax=Nocardiopsis metallicus TaxID=179819 RepID=A0A840WIF6_9ACTN|nr:helix-turn-helix transcriptional regulator [Nocardiopsis metallicus]MBB5491467.1 transcriptional regulator with XRE-family HTH domain [Nocardiopsis metallicus]
MSDKVLPEWKPFGTTLRRHRKRAGLSQAEVGEKLALSGGMIGHLERATRVPIRAHVRELDRIFATDGELVQQWLDIVEEKDVLPWFKDALESERRSWKICEYHPILIPGLLQIPAYTRVLVTARQVQKSREEIEEVVELRASRLPNLQPQRPILWFVVDQIVVDRVVGDERIMYEQLEHIVQLAEDDTIRFQVIPDEVRKHCGLCSPFRLMTMRDNRKLVRMEHTLGGTAYDKSDEIEEMAELFGALQAEALSPIRSIQLIQNIMKGLK